MALKLHVGCGTVYLDGYVNLDVEVPGYSFLAAERPDLMERNRTSVDRYYKKETLASERARRTFILPDLGMGPGPSSVVYGRQ